MEIVELEKKVLKRNEEIADENRKVFDEKKLFVCNLLSSPGSGKTSILERVSEQFENKLGIIVGDVETANDAERLDKYDIETVILVKSFSPASI